MRVCVLAGCVLLAAARPGFCTTYHVAPDSTGDFPNIQTAIDAAASGDEIVLSAGTFTGDGNWDVNFGTKDLVLRSVGGNGTTFVDCGAAASPPVNHLAFVLEGGQPASTRIEGITIQNVRRAGTGGAIYVRNASPVIRGVRFRSCVAGGPGLCVLVEAGQPLIDACEFTDNGSARSLVQCLMSAIHIQGSTFQTNTAVWLLELGGGVVENCSFGFNPSTCIFAEAHFGYTPHLYVQGCTFRYNGGPCLLIPSDAEAVVGRCEFVHNGGGGVRAGAIQANGSTTVRNCQMLWDQGRQGADIYFYSAGRVLIMDHCLVVQDEAALGEAVYAACQRLEVTHCTFLGSSGYTFDGRGNALTIDGGDVSIDHTIIAFGGQDESRGPDGAIHCLATPQALSVSCTDIFGNLGGDWTGCIADLLGTSGNLNVDPLFCTSWDTTLRADSPCAPPNSGACGLIGAFGAWCGPLALQERGWGSIKAAYR